MNEKRRKKPNNVQLCCKWRMRPLEPVDVSVHPHSSFIHHNRCQLLKIAHTKIMQSICAVYLPSYRLEILNEGRLQARLELNNINWVRARWWLHCEICSKVGSVEKKPVVQFRLKSAQKILVSELTTWVFVRMNPPIQVRRWWCVRARMGLMRRRERNGEGAAQAADYARTSSTWSKVSVQKGESSHSWFPLKLQSAASLPHADVVSPLNQ